MQEKIAVIVPAKAGGRKIEGCIRSLLELEYPSFEVIVADDGLDAESLRLLDNFKGKIRVIRSGLRGPSLARNLAAKETDTEYIAFTDSDCLVAKNWLSELMRIFKEHPEATGGGGVQELPHDASRFEKKVFLFMRKCGLVSDYARASKDGGISRVNHNPSYNAIYKREVYLKEGGFLEGLWPGEDVEFDYRLKKQGYDLFFNPGAVVYHYKPKTWESFLKMMHRYGLAQGVLVRRYGIFRKTQILPLLSLSFLFLILALLFMNKILALCFIFGIILLFLFYFSDFLSFFLFLSGIYFWHLGFMRGFFNGLK